MINKAKESGYFQEISLSSYKIRLDHILTVQNYRDTVTNKTEINQLQGCFK